jgi:general secretion pathway protein C
VSPRKNRRVTIAIVLLTLALTALFVAQGMTGLIASTFLALDTTTPVAAARRSPGRRTAATVERKDPCPILERNIFDSETGDLCHITVATEETGEEEGEPEELDPNAPLPHCEGSVRLVGALVNTHNREWSFAAITGASGKALLYREGMTIDGRLLVQIGSSNVVMRPETGSYCQLAMFDPESPEAGTARPTTRVSRTSMDDDEEDERPRRRGREGAIPASDIESGITRNSDTNFTVSRGLVDQLLTNQAELMRTARIIPHEENGRTVGVKLYGIRRNSLLGRLGLQNGDMLRTINGYDMTSPDSALEAYSRLRGANNLSVNVVRRGNPMALEYNIQ